MTPKYENEDGQAANETPEDFADAFAVLAKLQTALHTHPSAPEDIGTEREGNNTQVDNEAMLREATERTVSALNDPQSATMQQLRQLVFGAPDTSEIGCQSNFTPDRTPRQSLEDIQNHQPVTLTQAQLTEGIRALEADCPPRHFCLIHHTNDLSLCSGRCVVVTFAAEKEYRTIPCQHPATTHHGQHFDLMDPKCAGYFTCRLTEGLKHSSACPLSEEP